jgi:hypothetical protein
MVKPLNHSVAAIVWLISFLDSYVLAVPALAGP